MPSESDPAVLQQPTLVLNRSWVPIGTTTVSRALFLLSAGGARAVVPQTYELLSFWTWVSRGASDGAVVRTPNLRIPAPEVIVLGRFDKVPPRRVPFSRSNLYRRDHHRCQYCSRTTKGSDSSIDHVTPRSRGGETSWENCVLSCMRCNLKKGDRSLGCTGMKLQRRPRRPDWSPCLGVNLSNRRSSWRRFIGVSQWNIGLAPHERDEVSA